MQDRLPIPLGHVNMDRVMLITIKEKPVPLFFEDSWDKGLDHEKRSWMRSKLIFNARA